VIRKISLSWVLILLVAISGCGNTNSRLIADLQSGNREVRRQAVRELIQKPRTSEEVISALCEALGSDDVELRKLAVTALAGVADSSSVAVDALLVALEDQDEKIQFAAASSLLKMDPAMVEPREVVLSEIQNVNPRAMLLVAGLKSDGSWAVSALQEHLDHYDESVRVLARQALDSVASE